MSAKPITGLSRRSRRHARVALCLLVASATGVVAASRATPARADVVERVIAVVNDEAIWLSELRRRAAPFIAQIMQAPSQAQRVELRDRLYGEVLDHLIDEKLIQQAAARMRVRVTNDDVERAIANVRRQNNLSEEEFWEAVRQQGFAESAYRDDLRRQLLRLKVLNQRARGRVNITEAEVRARYDEEIRRANRTLRFRASHVFVQIAPTGTATDVAAARAQAESIRSGLDADTFQAAVTEHGGGDLGWLRQGDLPGPLEDELITLSTGEVSDIVQGPSGFHIFLLHERERGEANIPPYDEVREMIFRQMLDVAMSRQEEIFLSELRRGALIDRRL